MDFLKCRWLVSLRLMAAVSFLTLLLILPTTVIERAPSLCIFKNLFGLECAGCGLTRAFSHLLHGGLVTAIERNALIMVAFPIIVVMVIHDSLRLTLE